MATLRSLLVALPLLSACTVGPDEEVQEGLPPGEAVPVDDEDITVDESGNEPASDAEVVSIAGAYPAAVLAYEYASDLTKDGSYIYFTSYGSVRRVPTYGGRSTTVASAYYATGIAVDSSNVYWAEHGYSKGCSIKKISKASIVLYGSPTTLYHGAAGCTGLAIDATHVYWTNPETGELGSINKGGSGLVIRKVGGKPREIAVDNAKNIYWTDTASGSVKLRTAAGKSYLLATGKAPTFMKLAGDFVYFTNKDHGTVIRAYRWCTGCGGPGLRTMASGQAGPTGIDVNGSWLYWLNSDDGKVMKANLSDGLSRTRIATVLEGASKLIVRTRASRTPPSLYWGHGSEDVLTKIDQY